MGRAAWQFSAERFLQVMRPDMHPDLIRDVRLLGVRFSPFDGYIVEVLVEGPTIDGTDNDAEMAPVTFTGWRV